MEIGKAENSGNIRAYSPAGAMVGYLENPVTDGVSGSELTLDECIHRGGLRGEASETGRSPWLGGAETAVEIAGISGCRRGRTVASPHFSDQMIPQNFSHTKCNL